MHGAGMHHFQVECEMTCAQTASFSHHALAVSNIGLLLDCKVTGLIDVEMSLSSGHCPLFPGSLQPTDLPTAWTPQNVPLVLPLSKT